MADIFLISFVILWLFGIITFLISVGAGALADSREREEKEDEN